MKKEDKIVILKDYLEKNQTICTKTLTSFNISYSLLHELLENNILVKVKRGVYKKSENLSRNEQKLEKVDFKEFEQLLLNKKYQEAASLSISIEEMSKEEKRLWNLYLLLLSQFTELSVEQRAYVQTIKIEDCRIPDQPLLSKENKVRLSICNKNFFLSVKQIIEKYNDLMKMEKTDQIYLEMLKEIAKIDQIVTTLEIEMQKNNQYDVLQRYLKEREMQGRLSKKEKALQQLVNLISQKEPIQYSKKPCSSVFEGISCGNYEQALKWDTASAIENKIQDGQRLLKEALQKVLEKIECQKTSIDNEQKLNNQFEFSQILETLWEGNLEESTTLLSQYLDKKKKASYFSLLFRLIQIGMIEKDSFYKKFYEVFIQIEQGTYEYSITKYLLEFVSSLDENIEKAEVYFRILEYGKCLDVTTECFMLPELSKQLQIAKRKNM